MWLHRLLDLLPPFRLSCLHSGFSNESSMNQPGRELDIQSFRIDREPFYAEVRGEVTHHRHARCFGRIRRQLLEARKRPRVRSLTADDVELLSVVLLQERRLQRPGSSLRWRR